MDRDHAAPADVERARLLLAQFSRGYDLNAFLADEKTQSAILQQLPVLGEATKRLSATSAPGIQRSRGS